MTGEGAAFPELERLLRIAGPGPIVALTGAGISAESGIPTFRGAEGYWRVGSREYRPMELATHAAFLRHPNEVWGWYLYRRAVCRAAAPNAGHVALARLEQSRGDGFTLVTQNVDGLHLRAGSTQPRTLQIHGNLDFMRCAKECRPDITPLPEAMEARWEKGRLPDAGEQALLCCPHCGGPSRPHVLWFDEYYDEARFRAESALRAAAAAELLIVVGSSATTNVPVRIFTIAWEREIPVVVIDPEPTPFADLAERSPRGIHLRGMASAIVPSLAAVFERVRSS